MFTRVYRSLAVCLLVVSSLFLLTVLAPPASASSPENIKSVLIDTGAWEVHWQGNSSGVIEFAFEDRDGNVFVKIVNAAWNTSCERSVMVFGDRIEMDGCNEPGIVLNYTPGDKEYTFIGESKNVNFKMKPK